MQLDVGLYRFQFKAIPVIVTLVVFAVCARLGYWQLQRGWDKEVRLAQIAQYRKLDKMSLGDLLKLMEHHDPTGVSVKVQGQFISPYGWLLDNRVVNGQPGYDVLLPLDVEGFDQKVLVNMGWVKGDYAKRDVLPELTIPDGAVEIEAYVKAKDLASFVLSELSELSNNQRQWPTRAQQINLEAFEKQSGLALFPFVLYANQSQDFGFTHHYQPVVMPPEKHRGYALQWFLLALAAAIIFIFASKEQRVEREENDNERA